MRIVAIVIAVVAGILALGAVFVFSGHYDVAADAPHWPVTERMLATLRDRSIERAAAAIEVPKLDDPAMVADGSRQYAEMCAGCHLSPLSRDSEARQGLTPQPPDLYRNRVEPRRAFWVIKHGIKMSGMPAWGRSHDDATIWKIVAFLQKMPELDAQAYRSMAMRGGNEAKPSESAAGHHHDSGHHH